MEFDLIPTQDQLDKIADPEATVVPLVDAVNASLKGREGVDSFPVGFKIFDDVMNGGLTDGDLVLISGRTGHGKTTFAQTLTYHLNQIAIPVAWFSYEMQITEIWNKFKAMGFTEDNFIGYAPTKLKSGNIEWIEARINEAILKFNCKVFFIDHLGYLAPDISKLPGDAERNYSIYLRETVRQLKRLALDKNIIIVLLAHIRKTKEEPDIEDIAYSVGTSQEADFIFFVDRIRKKPVHRSEWEKETEMDGDVYTEFSKIKLAKNRRTGYNRFLKARMTNGRLVEVKNIQEPPPNEHYIE